MILRKYFSYAFIALLFLVSCSKKSGINLPELPGRGGSGGGGSTPSIEAIDTEIESFMKRFNVPGGSVAITKNGKLVYAKGYGYADKENDQKVDTSSLFRIASLSKFITSLGIMKLVEAGKLNMNDKVFGPGAILGTEYGTEPYGPYVKDITLRNVLQHEIGGWNNSNSDPAFQNPSMTRKQLISWTIDNRPLTAPPGTKLDYSNLGYFILGEIIEKLSGKPYETYIREEIFEPAGVKNMSIAGGSLAERKKNEVKYYGQGANAYGYSAGVISRLGPCGGWIGSPIDYLRILVRADGFATVPDMLQPSTISIMSTSSPNSVYGCGIRVNSAGNWWHGGGLTGTRTWMVRAANGFCWALFFNSKPSDETQFVTELDKLVWTAVKNMGTPWPNADYF
ncbi:MAG TPA: serine hydrolase domain-containing protein [Parasegetibacter sp.]